MTRKQKLCQEYYQLKNELNILRGEQPLDMERYSTGWFFENTAKSKTISEWEYDIQTLCYCLEREKREKEIADYFATEEGKLRKELLEERKESLLGERMRVVKKASVALENEIKRFLGDNWGIAYFNTRNVEIGLVEKLWDDGSSKLQFANNFSIYYDFDSRFAKTAFETARFEMNYGTCGSFNLFGEGDANRREFLRGMGKFASDVDELTEIKKLIYHWSLVIAEIEKVIDEVNAELSNPFKKVS